LIAFGSFVAPDTILSEVRMLPPGHTLTVTGGKVRLVDSSYRSIDPATPTITITGLSNTISDRANYTVSILGQQIANGSLVVTVDGEPVSLDVAPSSTGITAKGTIEAALLPDGVHTLMANVVQSDGMSAVASTEFATNAEAASITNQVTSLSNEAALWTNLTYGFAVLAVVAIILAAWAMMRKPAAMTSPNP